LFHLETASAKTAKSRGKISWPALCYLVMSERPNGVNDMKAAILILIAMLAGPQARAESIATGGALDPLVRIFTSCDNCQAMQKLRTEVFIPAQRNVRLKSRAAAKMEDVYAHAERLTDIAQNDRVSFRNAHYADEIEAFFYLASDSVQFSEDMQIAYTIAYLNSELGSRSIFEKVLNDEVLSRPENACRRDFFKRAVETKECQVANEIAAEGKKPQMKCPIMNGSVAQCEAKQAAKRSRIK
jgi:hypothetical protein